MSVLAALKTQEGIQDEVDSVGGNSVLDSGVYQHVITLAYLSQSKNGAMALNVHLKNQDGHELRQQFWMTSKDGNNFYVTKDGDKKYLPGFLLANSLCLLTVGKEIAELEDSIEQKVVSLYNFEQKKEVPTTVPVLIDLLGKEILSGVIRQVVDKTKKDASGNYVPTGETREENEIDKFFRARDRMTVAEIRAEATEAEFINTWLGKWEGKVRNRAKGVNGQKGVAGAPAAAAPAPKKSLFS